MWWFIFALIAAVMGFMMYNSIEDQLPEWMPKSGNGKSNQKIVRVVKTTDIFEENMKGVVYKRFIINKEGDNVDIKLSVENQVPGFTENMDYPSMHFGCYDYNPFFYLEFPIQPTVSGETENNDKYTPVEIYHGKLALGHENWNIGKGNKVFANQPEKELAGIYSNNRLSYTMVFDQLENQKQSVEFKYEDVKELMIDLKKICDKDTN